MKKIYILVFALCGILTVACKSGGKTDEHGHDEGSHGEEKEEVLAPDIVELRADQIKLAGIQTGNFEKRAIGSTLKVTGAVTVSPQNLATVSMPMGGYVKSTSLTPGSRVSKGQTLAMIENKEFINLQQNYLEAKNKLQFAENDYTRHKELYKEDVYSQKNMQQVTMEFHNQRATVKALEQKLALIGIDTRTLTEDNIRRAIPLTAPISGYLKAANVSIGKSVLESDVLFEIVNTDKLLLELTVFEKDVDKVSTGNKVRFVLNNEKELHDARITMTSKSVGVDKSMKTYAEVTGRCPNMFPGMYVNATIESPAHQATVLPSEAIVSFEDKDYIFIFEKNKTEHDNSMTEYRMIQVQKGVSENGLTEVIVPEKYNSPKIKVVVKGAYNLLSAKKNAGEMSCG